MKNTKSLEQARVTRVIFLPNISLSLISVNGTEFQHLVSNVSSDVTLAGISSIHAGPGVGTSVAVALSVLGWARDNPNP